MQKSCKQCNKNFIVEDDDLAFYKKISPIFAGKVFEIPPPTLCSECRDARRYNWRNERTLYRRKCDKTGKDIVAMYAPNSGFIVWDNNEWHKDDWDPMSYGREYDDTKSFFRQFCDLLKDVPRPPNTLFNDEGCDFCNFMWDSKNCYIVFSTMDSEDCMYSWRVFRSKNTIDSLDTKDSEYCYSCLNSAKCYKCQNCERCINCAESYFSFDCRNCSNVFMCVGLRNKRFCIRNKQYSQKEYFEELGRENLGSRVAREKLLTELEAKKFESIFPENFNLQCENCTGDYLIGCKNCANCYFINDSEDSKHIHLGNAKVKNCMDSSQVANAEYCYEITGASGNKNLFCPWSMYGNNNLYSNFCENCTDCFGCFGLKHKRYCILNKQYSKEEYESIVSRIIEKMKEDEEWGEFFPLWSSPFAYNESMANIYYPKSREEALKLKAKWQEEDFGPKYNGSVYKPEDDIVVYRGNEKKMQEVLNGIVKCESSGKPFKILPQELAFYIENNIPIPTKHYDTRFLEKLALINPRKLYRRQCMCEESGHDHLGRCKVEFETTYAPDRPEKVYCEKCYQKVII